VVVASDEVAEFVREEVPDVVVTVVGWGPCEQ
jgi:hypothetical protein